MILIFLCVIASPACPSGESHQTTRHIVEECPLTAFPGGLRRLHEAGPDAVEGYQNRLCNCESVPNEQQQCVRTFVRMCVRTCMYLRACERICVRVYEGLIFCLLSKSPRFGARSLYNRTDDLTLEFIFLILVFLISFDFQLLLRMRKAPRAFGIRAINAFFCASSLDDYCP